MLLLPFCALLGPLIAVPVRVCVVVALVWPIIMLVPLCGDKMTCFHVFGAEIRNVKRLPRQGRSASLGIGGAGEGEGRSVLYLGGKPSAQLLADQTFSIIVDAGSLLGLLVVQYVCAALTLLFYRTLATW